MGNHLLSVWRGCVSSQSTCKGINLCQKTHPTSFTLTGQKLLRSLWTWVEMVGGTQVASLFLRALGIQVYCLWGSSMRNSEGAEISEEAFFSLESSGLSKPEFQWGCSRLDWSYQSHKNSWWLSQDIGCRFKSLSDREGRLALGFP